MAREDGGGGGGVAAAERRQAVQRILLPRGEAASSSPPPTEEGPRKGFASAALRGLGCTSAAASQVYVPATADAALRSSGDWQARRRRERKEKRKGRGGGLGGGLAGVGMGGDLWCTPGIPYAAEASSVDCVVARHQVAGRGRGGEAERQHRQRPCIPRRVTMREHMSSSFMDSPPHLDTPRFDTNLLPSGRLRRMHRYHHSHVGIEEEIMMFQARVLLGRMSMHDQYQDWHLDVDNMTYEELLDLGDRIGYVSTGLRDDEIIHCLRKVKYSAFNSLLFPTEMERKCSICQEEYEANEEIGRLDCGHSYHVCCIKQWLSQKNACPVCKTAVSRT